MNRMLYVRKADETFWVRAEEVANRRHMPLAVLVSEVLRNWFYAGGDKDEPEKPSQKTPDELIVEAQDALQQLQSALSVQEG